jgi:hypothetical protein
MGLLLGPALRHVSDTTALVWVQTENACTIEILGCSARTFEVSGYHFAVVHVTGLTPDSVTEYQVSVDGTTVWPEAGSNFPPSVIRTRGPAGAHRVRAIFGSCRYPKTEVKKVEAKLKQDALDSYATRMSGRPIDEWPDALILLGDQLYADELPPDEARRVAGRRRNRHGDRPPHEVVTFAEYERLYRHSWGDPEIRWLMSTVPTAMIFDDHDIRDDWNTSATWRNEMAHEPWWRDRIRAGLASYWVYQHLGNLSPAELDDNDDYQRLLATEGDTWPHLAEVAERADREVDCNKGIRFSYRWDLGRTRLIMVDSRNGRILESGERMMVGENEFRWVEAKAEEDLETLDHLMLASSVPWLMPPAIGDLETLNERMADRPGWRGRMGERLRQAGDFRALARVLQVIRAAGRDDRQNHRASRWPRDDQRALRRRAPQLRCTCRTRRRVIGRGDRASAGVLAGAQLRAAVHQTGIHAQLDSACGGRHPMVGPQARGALASDEVGQRMRAAVRQHHRHAGDQRP